MTMLKTELQFKLLILKEGICCQKSTRTLDVGGWREQQHHKLYAEEETYAKVRFLATKGFSTTLPSSLIFSRAFSAAAALPDWAPPDRRCTISVCRMHTDQSDVSSNKSLGRSGLAAPNKSTTIHLLACTKLHLSILWAVCLCARLQSTTGSSHPAADSADDSSSCKISLDERGMHAACSTTAFHACNENRTVAAHKSLQA